MPLQKLTYRPGVNREGTDYSNEGGFYLSDKVRFRSGLPEKIGGWVQVNPSQYVGVCRALWSWINLNGLSSYIGVGTSSKYYIYFGGTYNDITPISYTSSLTAAIATVASSYVLTITDGNYSPNVGDYVLLSATSNVGGINIATSGVNANNEYIVASVLNATQYTVTSSNAASSTATGGGTVIAQYEYPVGLITETVGTGWGSGPWGGDTTSPVLMSANPITTTASSSTVTIAFPNTFIVNATALVVGQQYQIVASGTTNWTSIGASSTAVGTVFTATNVGTGSGTAAIVTVALSGAASVGGVPAAVLNNTFQISNISAAGFTITLPNSYKATSSATGGGSSVYINVQEGSRGWGTGYTSGIALQLRLWTNDNYGADLAIAPRGGPIYYWVAANGVSTRAVALSSLASNSTVPGTSYTYQQFVPLETNQILSAPIQQFLIAMGANSYNPSNPNTAFNPMLVRWSDQANQFTWVPSTTNQSGEFQLTNGSYIMQSQTTRQEILIWTDSCLYSMQYIGFPYVWSFQVLMDNISIMSPNSAVTVNNVTYWMGKDKFYMYNGTVSTLPCSLRQYVFDDINTNQSFQVFSGSNEGYNEVWWFYVSNSSGSNQIDKYVIYNYLDKVWTYGTMARTAWLQYGINPYPVAADYNNRLLYHEVGTDDVSTSSPQPITSYIQSSDFGIDAGDHLGFVWRMLPDVNFNGSTVNNPSVTMTLYGRQNSGATVVTSDVDSVISANNYTSVAEYPIQQFSGEVYTRIRARQMAFNITSTGLGVAWQLGVPRIDVKPDGRR